MNGNKDQELCVCETPMHPCSKQHAKNESLMSYGSKEITNVKSFC